MFINDWQIDKMKTTNYEISKKLKEVGFKKDSHCGYMFDGEDHQLCVWNAEEKWSDADERDYLSYDLETILDALPEMIWREEKDFVLWYDKVKFVYSHTDEWIFESIKKKDEFLADTAARLLLELHEKGIIKF